MTLHPPHSSHDNFETFTDNGNDNDEILYDSNNSDVQQNINNDNSFDLSTAVESVINFQNLEINIKRILNAVVKKKIIFIGESFIIL